MEGEKQEGGREWRKRKKRVRKNKEGGRKGEKQKRAGKP